MADSSEHIPPKQNQDFILWLIPYKNPWALVGYYLAVFGLIPGLGLPLSMAAIALGIVGIRRHQQEPWRKGAVHARVALVGGVMGTLVSLSLVAVIVMWIVGGLPPGRTSRIHAFARGLTLEIRAPKGWRVGHRLVHKKTPDRPELNLFAMSRDRYDVLLLPSLPPNGWTDHDTRAFMGASLRQYAFLKDPAVLHADGKISSATVDGTTIIYTHLRSRSQTTKQPMSVVQGGFSLNHVWIGFTVSGPDRDAKGVEQIALAIPGEIRLLYPPHLRKQAISRARAPISLSYLGPTAESATQRETRSGYGASRTAATGSPGTLKSVTLYFADGATLACKVPSFWEVRPIKVSVAHGSKRAVRLSGGGFSVSLILIEIPQRMKREYWLGGQSASLKTMLTHNGFKNVVRADQEVTWFPYRDQVGFFAELVQTPPGSTARIPEAIGGILEGRLWLRFNASAPAGLTDHLHTLVLQLPKRITLLTPAAPLRGSAHQKPRIIKYLGSGG